MARSRPRLIRSNQTTESCRWLAMSVLYPEGKEHPGPEKQTSSRKWLQGLWPGRLRDHNTREQIVCRQSSSQGRSKLKCSAEQAFTTILGWEGNTNYVSSKSLSLCHPGKKTWKTTKLLLAWSPDGFHFWKGQRALGLNQDKEGHTMHFRRCTINYQSKPLLPGN